MWDGWFLHYKKYIPGSKSFIFPTVLLGVEWFNPVYSLLSLPLALCLPNLDFWKKPIIRHNRRLFFASLPRVDLTLASGNFNALRVSPAVTRLTVYRGLQVIRGQCLASFQNLIHWQIRTFWTFKLNVVTRLIVVLRSDNFPTWFRMRRISHAKNQLRGWASFGDLCPTSSS